ncbi:hypothetical protein [Pseudomonas citronellolis]|uniref:hypothetical protein n=1 Tax=Pseudomonas citronellolis TaxID=53408 RepID=UPI00248E0919|nr:hypothetical protein [Pseudomonas citronellolis]
MNVHGMSRAAHEPLVTVVDGVPTFTPDALDLIAKWPFPPTALNFYLRAMEELHQAVVATGAPPELHEQMKAQASKAWRTERTWAT